MIGEIRVALRPTPHPSACGCHLLPPEKANIAVILWEQGGISRGCGWLNGEIPRQARNDEKDGCGNRSLRFGKGRFSSSLIPWFCPRRSSWHNRVSAVENHRKRYNISFSRFPHPEQALLGASKDLNFSETKAGGRLPPLQERIFCRAGTRADSAGGIGGSKPPPYDMQEIRMDKAVFRRHEGVIRRGGNLPPAGERRE